MNIVYFILYIHYYNYPFLEKAWTKYEEFENPVEEKEGFDKNYNQNCALIIWTLGEHTKKYRSFCEKLIRNLEPYKNKKIIDPSDKCCKSLQSWLYYFKMKYSIPNNFIQECYKKSQPLHGLRVNTHICPYYLYEEVNNAEKDKPKINIFVDNFSTIQNILKEKNHTHNCLGWKFLYECFKIYKKINKDYCSKGENSDTINICLQLKEFRTHYDTLICTISEIPEKIKSQDEDFIEFTDDDCLLNESKKESVSDEDQSTSSSVPSITTTALCTVAGVSSTLALLYKV
ncbi:hypothetical protein PVIIG_05410 [Plasmodium vivax India VII]|uniref:PIR Superfamily Protein n=1 Tax=Plasmodium vivax India VII TaxID=1077284 RepID=A0A0J9UTW3_PLAVI|nr:hypothetical protein PVIIG_05410 [Plasmodium vivax India VII]